jgi:hypothetical protein
MSIRGRQGRGIFSNAFSGARRDKNTGRQRLPATRLRDDFYLVASSRAGEILGFRHVVKSKKPRPLFGPQCTLPRQVYMLKYIAHAGCRAAIADDVRVLLAPFAFSIYRLSQCTPQVRTHLRVHVLWLPRITTRIPKNALGALCQKTRVAPTKHGKPEGELVTLIL